MTIGASEWAIKLRNYRTNGLTDYRTIGLTDYRD